MPKSSLINHEDSLVRLQDGLSSCPGGWAVFATQPENEQAADRHGRMLQLLINLCTFIYVYLSENVFDIGSLSLFANVYPSSKMLSCSLRAVLMTRYTGTNAATRTLNGVRVTHIAGTGMFRVRSKDEWGDLLARSPTAS